MKRFLLLLLLFVGMLFFSCDNPVDTETVIGEVILITMRNNSELTLRLYQDEYLTNLLPRYIKTILCKPGLIDVVTENKIFVSFIARNNKTYTYSDGVITEEN